MCVHSHPEALTCPTGGLNTSAVNEVMLYLCGSRATESLCSPAQVQVGGSCLPSWFFLTHVCFWHIKGNQIMKFQGCKSWSLLALCQKEKEKTKQFHISSPVCCRRCWSQWSPGCCLPVGEDLSVIGEMVEELQWQWFCVFNPLLPSPFAPTCYNNSPLFFILFWNRDSWFVLTAAHMPLLCTRLQALQLPEGAHQVPAWEDRRELQLPRVQLQLRLPGPTRETYDGPQEWTGSGKNSATCHD